MSGDSVKNIVFLCNGHDEVLKRWALNCLAESLVKEGIQARVVDLAKGGRESELFLADVVVVYRSFDLRVLRLMRRLRAEGVFVFFFLDDYLFQQGCRYTGDWTTPMAPMEEADGLVSSSSFLLSKMPDKPKILRRSVLSEEAVSLLKQDYRRGERFSVGWTAGRGRFGVMDSFMRDFLKILDNRMEEGEECVFRCFGSRCFPATKKVEVREHVWFRPDDWKGLYTALKSFDLGVIVNPLEEDDDFCRAKSELKFVESGALGVPLVTSRVEPYTEFIREGENGFFASSPREFADKVLIVMRNEELSRAVSMSAGSIVVSEYNARANARKFFDDVMGVIDSIRRKK